LKLLKIIALAVGIIVFLVLSWLFPNDMRTIGNIYAAVIGTYYVITLLVLPVIRRIDLWMRRLKYSNDHMLDHSNAIANMQTIYVECPGCGRRVVLGGHRNSWDVTVNFREDGEKVQKVCGSCGTVIRIQGNPWDED
jgi:hypothetical protein